MLSNLMFTLFKSHLFADSKMIPEISEDSKMYSMKTRLYVQEVSEGQLANTSSSCGTLPSEVVGGADGEGLTTHPPPPFASP